MRSSKNVSPTFLSSRNFLDESMMPWLLLNRKKYSLEELRSLPIDGGQAEFEKSAVSFCQAWLAGQKEFVLPTSGSTGAPKQITLQRTQMEVSAKMTIAALQLQAGETSLVCLDTQYIAGKMMLVRSLIAEMNIIVVEPSANPFDKIKKQQIDFVALVPYQLETALENSIGKLNQVRCAIVGGAAINYSLKEIKKTDCSIFATYGMTETISHIALQKLNGDDRQDFFEAMPNIHLRVDDRGCLCIKATHLGEEIITNDLVELIELKKFRWLGRIDNVINSGGVKIIPERVEMVFEKIMHQFLLTNRFFVFGAPHEKLGQQVQIVFEGNVFEESVQEKIVVEAGLLLTKYELPKKNLFLSSFQETANGKIDRGTTVALLK